MLLELTQEELDNLLDNGEIAFSVFGLGRVGLPLAVAWLRAGQKVIGADTDPEVVDKINNGISPFMDEEEIPESVEKFVQSNMFSATTHLDEASEKSDVKLIAVPTTPRRGNRYSDGALKETLRAIGRNLKKGDAVSIECSVPPTTTEGWAKPILEEESGLEVDGEFALVFSPQRIYEGRALEDLEERYPKIVGGVGPRSTELFTAIYQRIARRGVIRMSGSTAAEASKLFEGVYRDVNIALANELAKLCNALDLSYYEIREASNSQPFSHLHEPGVGVGGACIPCYPIFLQEKSGQLGLSLPLTEIARTINDGMPEYSASMAIEALGRIGKELKGVKTTILGLAFRGGVSDARNSPSYGLIDILSEHGAEMVVHDPLITKDQVLESKGVTLVSSLEEALSSASLIIMATNHGEYSELNLDRIAGLVSMPAVIIDGRNVIETTEVPRGLFLSGIGKRSLSPEA
jgi:nucleotide sugar dehydrogenase